MFFFCLNRLNAQLIKQLISYQNKKLHKPNGHMLLYKLHASGYCSEYVCICSVLCCAADFGTMKTAVALLLLCLCDPGRSDCQADCRSCSKILPKQLSFNTMVRCVQIQTQPVSQTGNFNSKSRITFKSSPHSSWSVEQNQISAQTNKSSFSTGKQQKPLV